MTNSEIINVLGGTARVAKLCGVSAPAVSMWRSNGIPQDKMIFIAASLEKATGGEVTRKQLFPNTWQDIWTELQ